MENFIGIYKNAFDSEYCKQVIDWFELANNLGFGKNRIERNQIQRHKVDDISIFWDIETISLSPAPQLTKKFIDVFWTNCYSKYASKFSILDDIDRHALHELKLQKTKPGGGYHLWHCENGLKRYSDRLLVFNLYLNDISEGGETEFLYYGLRVKPEQGTLIVWPAGFTHTHRGNPPLQETKYIITGWIEFE